MIYFTFNDNPTGIYKSQVVDFVKYLEELKGDKINLISFISLKNFISNRKIIKVWCPEAKVYPMLPGLRFWKYNRFLIGWINGFRKDPIIARGPLACYLALSLSSKVCYDGRGAIKAEVEEFPSMIPDLKVRESFIEGEKNSILKSKFRISVSNKLIEYWMETYAFNPEDYIVTPCTLSTDFLISRNFKISSNPNIQIVFSGGTGGWQSFESLVNILETFLDKGNVEVKFLTKSNSYIDFLQKKFPKKVFQKWVSHDKVFEELSQADYGILYREVIMTNYVASPVKFAEYLAAGCKVLISPHLGDFSDLVQRDNLGHVLINSVVVLQKTSLSEKIRLRNYALSNFSKNFYKEKYRFLIDKLK